MTPLEHRHSTVVGVRLLVGDQRNRRGGTENVQGQEVSSDRVWRFGSVWARAESYVDMEGLNRMYTRGIGQGDGRLIVEYSRATRGPRRLQNVQVRGDSVWILGQWIVSLCVFLGFNGFDLGDGGFAQRVPVPQAHLMDARVGPDVSTGPTPRFMSRRLAS